MGKIGGYMRFLVFLLMYALICGLIEVNVSGVQVFN